MAEYSETIIESRVVAGKHINIHEFRWPDGVDTIYDVYRVDSGVATLVEESCDHVPTDEEIIPLVRDLDEPWSCPVCDWPFAEDERHLYDLHRRSSCVIYRDY